MLRDPADAVAADLVLVESTYGDRDHERDDNGEALAEIIRDTVRRGGKLIVPAFAIGRVGEVLYWIRRLESENRIPALPVHVDSPMANEALRFYSARVSELDEDMRPEQKGVWRLRRRASTWWRRHRQSKELTASRKPAIVISSSGMATGGRVLHHMAAALPDPRHTVLFVGYQAVGTRGRLLVDGCARRQDPRPADTGGRAHREDRFDVGARRSRRDRAVAGHAAEGRRRVSAWCTARRDRWMPCARSSPIASDGTRICRTHGERIDV